jgi:hypothetical protein
MDGRGAKKKVSCYLALHHGPDQAAHCDDPSQSQGTLDDVVPNDIPPSISSGGFFGVNSRFSLRPKLIPPNLSKDLGKLIVESESHPQRGISA